MAISDFTDLKLEVAGTQAQNPCSGYSQQFTMNTSAAKSMCLVPIAESWLLSISKYL